MRRPKLSNEQRERMLENLDKQIILKERRKRLYNKRFRKSFVFLSSLSIRILYIVLFVMLTILHTTTFNSSKEVLKSRIIDRKTGGGKGATSILYLETDKGQYTADISGLSIPPFDEGDTMIIQKNIFNKPTFFTKKTWYYKYELTVNFGRYFTILFLTIISLFFNDGLDKSTLKISWAIALVDLAAIVLYFLS